jgi:hypothetical protein
MADRIATYAFTDKENYDAAKYKLNSELDDYCWDSGTTSDYWLLHIKE